MGLEIESHPPCTCPVKFTLTAQAFSTVILCTLESLNNPPVIGICTDFEKVENESHIYSSINQSTCISNT